MSISNPVELEAVVKKVNDSIIAAQHKHVEEAIERLERRLNDLRSSLSYAKQDGRLCEVECNLGNIITSATTALARSPKTVNSFDLYVAVKNG